MNKGAECQVDYKMLNRDTFRKTNLALPKWLTFETPDWAKMRTGEDDSKTE